MKESWDTYIIHDSLRSKNKFHNVEVLKVTVGFQYILKIGFSMGTFKLIVLMKKKKSLENGEMSLKDFYKETKDWKCK